MFWNQTEYLKVLKTRSSLARKCLQWPKTATRPKPPNRHPLRKPLKAQKAALTLRVKKTRFRVNHPERGRCRLTSTPASTARPKWSSASPATTQPQTSGALAVFWQSYCVWRGSWAVGGRTMELRRGSGSKKMPASCLTDPLAFLCRLNYRRGRKGT